MSSSSYRTAFETAQRKAGTSFRFYDARHTFVTRLAENPAVSEERPFANSRAMLALGWSVGMPISVCKPAGTPWRGSNWATKSRFPPIVKKVGHNHLRGPKPAFTEMLRLFLFFRYLELAPRAGFEPATRRLTAVCSTD
jgi:hypothetical protein